MAKQITTTKGQWQNCTPKTFFVFLHPDFLLQYLWVAILSGALLHMLCVDGFRLLMLYPGPPGSFNRSSLNEPTFDIYQASWWATLYFLLRWNKPTFCLWSLLTLFHMVSSGHSWSCSENKALPFHLALLVFVRDLLLQWTCLQLETSWGWAELTPGWDS